MHLSTTEEIKFLFLVRVSKCWILSCITFFSLGAESKYNFKPDYPFQKPAKVQEEPYIRPPYVAPGKPSWAEDVFTDKLIADFHRRYEELYGAFESFRLIRSYPMDQYMLIVDNLTLRDEMIRESEVMGRIGEYIFLKAGEYQIDSYLRSDPKTKGIYKAKEKFTNGSLNLASKVSIKTKYSISGNYLEASTTIHDMFYSYRMVLKKWTDGFLQPSEQIFLMDYNLNKRNTLRALYYIENSGFSITIRRKFKEQVTTSVTFNKDRRLPVENIIEDSLMLGLAFYEAPSLSPRY